jgi:hypothetical protein
VYGSEEATDALSEHFPVEYASLFNRIRISACRSDVARWVLLWLHGGVYVDAHSGPPGNMESLTDNESLLSNHELVVFEKVRKDSVSARRDLALNVIMAQAGSVAVKAFIGDLFHQLFLHAESEASTSQYVPYNIFALTGGWRAYVHFFDFRSTLEPVALRAEFLESICVRSVLDDPILQPVRLYAHYQYRVPGQHWSERQKTERLFADGIQGCEAELSLPD